MTPDPKTVSARLRTSIPITSALCVEAADLIDAQAAEIERLKGLVAHQDEEIEALQIAHTAQYARASAAESSLARLQAVYEAASKLLDGFDEWGQTLPASNALRTALTAYEKGDNK